MHHDKDRRDDKKPNNSHYASSNSRLCVSMGGTLPVQDRFVVKIARSKTSMSREKRKRDERPPRNNKEDVEYTLFFLRLGTDMTRLHIEGNAKIQGLQSRGRLRGARVLREFHRHSHPPYPTHLVVSNNPSLTAQRIATALDFDSAQQLDAFLTRHTIACVLRKWADKGNAALFPPFLPPTRLELYHGFVARETLPESAPSSPTRTIATSPQRRQLSSPSAQNPGDATVSAPPAAAASSVPSSQAIRRTTFKTNLALSDLFRDLAKAYQSAPLEDDEPWKSLSFSTTAGRLLRLDFEVTSASQLDPIPGFGPSTIRIVREYFETGGTRCSRLDELRANPDRDAVRTMVKIWGVGPVKAKQLVAVAKTIPELRQALEAGIVTLDRNQLIGLECYDDIQEEMTRSEVEAIFAIVCDSVRRRYPSIELSLMGSYRRGKEGCGDADILLTHPDHVESIPPKALGKLVDELHTEGRIAYHLTYLAGMQPDRFETLPESSRRYLTDPSHYGRAFEKKRDGNRHGGDGGGPATYFGVFWSPCIPGRRRRVDLKFYPHRERIFATVYFTGNGHFNRSMRLWADRKKGWTLNDRGLFERHTESRVRIPPGKGPEFIPRSEREVFDVLGLAWKEPHERDCFDAVEAVDGTVFEVAHLSQKEKESERNHAWIE